MKPSAAALHEAAHAAVAAICGIPVISASVDPVAGGEVLLEGPGNLLQKGRNHAALGVAYGLVALAGPIVDPGGNMSDDDRAMLANGLFLASLRGSRESLTEALTQLASDLVTRHHAAITRIATALDERLTLTGDDVLALTGLGAE